MRLTDGLIDRTRRAALRHRELQTHISEAFLLRYGIHYSDLDADEIIDTLDCGHGYLSVEDCDTIMTNLGYPPKKGETLPQSTDLIID